MDEMKEENDDSADDVRYLDLQSFNAISRRLGTFSPLFPHSGVCGRLLQSG